MNWCFCVKIKDVEIPKPLEKGEPKDPKEPEAKEPEANEPKEPEQIQEHNEQYIPELKKENLQSLEVSDESVSDGSMIENELPSAVIRPLPRIIIPELNFESLTVSRNLTVQNYMPLSMVMGNSEGNSTIFRTPQIDWNGS